MMRRGRKNCVKLGERRCTRKRCWGGIYTCGEERPIDARYTLMAIQFPTKIILSDDMDVMKKRFLMANVSRHQAHKRGQ